jgi:predicted PurR-regulated permease PerM
MIEKVSSTDAVRILVIGAALVIIIAGIHVAHSVLTSLLVAVFLAVIGSSPVQWLERKGVPAVVAVLLVVASMAAVLAINGVLVGASLNSFASDLPKYQALWDKYFAALQAYLATKGIRITDQFLAHHVDPSALMNYTAHALAALGSAVVEIVMILLTVTFILLEASSFPVKIRAILGDDVKDFHCFSRFTRDLNRYLVIKTGISLAAGILAGIWLVILGVDYPVLWGFLVFLLHYVPNVGSLIAAIPPAILALIQLGTGHALLTVAGYIAVNFTLGNVVEPKLMGHKLGLSTLAVFLSMILWGSLFGPIGLVLAVPFTMTLRFVCEHNENFRWMSVLLGPEKPAEEALPASKKEPVPAAAD